MIERPDIVVAIDLGTTYTGVGWARPHQTEALQTPIQILHNWPGASARNEQKVHTCLVYNADGRLSSWGFLCEEDEYDSDKSRKEFFKIFLDHGTLLDAHRQGITAAPATTGEAQSLVTDYLRQIYAHVKETIEAQTGISSSGSPGGGGWGQLAVEFIFSVPTTWRSQELINTFKAVVRRAGFGVEGPRHTATVELTESEAAAVATVKSAAVNFRPNDVFMSVDAGGGTTDFAVMQVLGASGPFPTLAQIAQVDGVGIGATLIDRAFLALVADRIYSFPELEHQLPSDCPERLVRSEKYRTMKHKFGERVYASDVYRLPLEGVGYNFSHPGAGIEHGRILISREEIQSLFDPQIESMLQKIREQLTWVKINTQARQVDYMVLSGGLGSSAYVRDRLQEELVSKAFTSATGGGGGGDCSRQIRILQAPDAQLVVVKGLLLDRLQKLDTGYMPVLVQRRARASYGVVCKMKYNPEIHGNMEDVRKDPLDGELYATGQIDWIIRKGDMIDPSSSVAASFSQKLDPGSTVRAWDSIVMISHCERDHLPRSSRDVTVKKLCTVKSDLTGIPNSELILKKRSRGRFRRSKKFYVCNFEVRVVVAPAEIRFELWFNGQKFSRNHEPIQVTWDSAGTELGAS